MLTELAGLLTSLTFKRFRQQSVDVVDSVGWLVLGNKNRRMDCLATDPGSNQLQLLLHIFTAAASAAT